MITACLMLSLLTTTPVGQCIPPVLMVRTEAQPRSAAFALGAQAFDQATADWKKKRYLEAAHGFLAASAHFAAAGVEGNWKYSWQNAARAFEQADKVEEGKAAFEAAAVKDPAHAEALREAASKLSMRGVCR